MDKNALLERLVRLGATDVPGTPRLLMRKRSPEELAQLQHGVENAFGRVQKPIEGALHGAADKVFTPRIAGAVKGIASMGVKNPEIIPMQAVPVPGLTPAYLAGKKGLEKLIDKVAPVGKLAFATSQYSYPLNPVIPSQASSQPGFLAPNLQSAVQKRKQAAGAPTRGNFMMASDVPSFTPPNLQSPIQKRSGASGLDEPNQPVQKVGDLDLAFDPAPTGKKKAAQLPGGLADKEGKKLSDFPRKKLDEGEKIEHEHTSSHHLARTIAMDHLTEDPKYYAKLRKVEAKEKDSDMLPDFVTYSPGDFKRSKYAMPLEDMAKFVARLREKAAGANGIMGVSPSLGGAAQAAKSVGAPKLSGPGPSIAQIAKPKGPHFGSGIAGAFKGSIGGRAPQALG